MKQHLAEMRKRKLAAADKAKSEADKNSSVRKTSAGKPATVGKFPTNRPVFGKPGDFN